MQVVKAFGEGKLPGTALLSQLWPLRTDPGKCHAVPLSVSQLTGDANTSSSLPEPHHWFQHVEVSLYFFLLRLLWSSAVMALAPSRPVQDKANHRDKSYMDNRQD